MRAFLFGQRVMNTFYYMFTSGAPLTDGSAFLDDFNVALEGAGGVYDAWKGCVSSDVINITADLQWISPSRYVKKTYIVGPVGDLGGTALTNTASVLTMRSVIADRRSLAHKHLPGLPNGEATGGIISGALSGALDNLGSQLALDVAVLGRTMSPIVYGRARPAYTDKHGNLHPALPESKRLIDSWIVSDTARTMRRRTVGVGE
jgi:hypothetical protein